MSDATDMELVREFAERNTEAAFAELVRSHINLVYSVALRFTGNAADAEDVAQAVFVILARKAGGLRNRPVITGWIYETTRLAALQFLRNRARRHEHEQEAPMEILLQSADDVWPQLAPLLEEAMSRLSEKDRTLLALRYFENRSNEESAALLGIGEWAARKRSERALEKLRSYFSTRGVDSTTAIIAESISANSLQSAPATLAISVTAIALAKGAAASASTATLIQGALKVMAWTKAKTAIVAGAVIILATTATTVVGVKMNKARHANAVLSKSLAPQSLLVTNDIALDGTMICRGTIQEINTSNRVVSTDFIGDSDIKITMMTDEAGRPMKFTPQNPRGYLVTLNNAVPPGGKICYSVVANWTGMIRPDDQGVFQIALTNDPGMDLETRYAMFFSLPPGATLIDKFDGMLEATNADRIEVGFDQVLPIQGKAIIGFRYRLAAQ